MLATVCTLSKLVFSAERDQDIRSGGFGHQAATSSTGTQYERLPRVSATVQLMRSVVTLLLKVEGYALCTPCYTLKFCVL